MRPAKLRAVAFDLDGTLLDSRGDIAAAYNHVAAWAGRPRLAQEVIAGFVGDGARALLARGFGIARDAPEMETLYAEWLRYYVANPVAHSTWMPGAREAMAELDRRCVPIALVTNKARAVTVAILDALGVSSRFAAVYAGGDGPLKPGAEPVLEVARRMGADARDTWMVGDAAQDVGAGRAAGAFTVAVLGGFHDEARLGAADPHVVLESLHELEGLLVSA
jgi:2-phosphoglycolate phosphatase